jgi:hypothetical protein
MMEAGNGNSSELRSPEPTLLISPGAGIPVYPEPSLSRGAAQKASLLFQRQLMGWNLVDKLCIVYIVFIISDISGLEAFR